MTSKLFHHHSGSFLYYSEHVRPRDQALHVTSGPMSTAGYRQAEKCVRFLTQMFEGVKKKQKKSAQFSFQKYFFFHSLMLVKAKGKGRWQSGVPTHQSAQVFPHV